MDVLGKTVLPRQNGFAGRQIRFAWIDQAKWILNYFLRSYLFVYLTQLSRKKQTENMFSYIVIRNKFINKHIKIEFRMI